MPVKLTKNQREYLVRIYTRHGYKASCVVAKYLGVSVRYAAKLAAKRNLKMLPHVRRVRLSDEQREELLKVYVEQGYVASLQIAKRYGVSSRYACRLAARRGVKMALKARMPSRPYCDRTDHRWAWARERGAISL